MARNWASVILFPTARPPNRSSDHSEQKLSRPQNFLTNSSQATAGILLTFQWELIKMRLILQVENFDISPSFKTFRVE